MKPFLKWAGGKFKIVDRVLAALPVADTLVEPFVGSGAVFLNANYKHYVLADTNSDLIHLYQEVQLHGQNFVDVAMDLFTPNNNTEVQFYALRDEFNACTDIRRRAALFIYLNRHCFNGLCRYNSKGGFNVPFGRYTKPQFPLAEVLNFHEKSQAAEFVLSDFRRTLSQVSGSAVVYCDPPYAPINASSNFSDYTKEGFGLQDQKDLAAAALTLQSQGTAVVISNHDTAFTRELYEGAKIEAFDVQRFISSNASNRKKAAEMLAVFA
jgi:DNA adenine methylase